MTEQFIKDALSRASELSEEWTGTIVGDVLDAQKERAEALIESGDPELISAQILTLVQSCNNIESQQNEQN